jgi:hypothetical protein
MHKCKRSGCGADIGFWENCCRVCGEFHSYPNVRKARDEREALLRLYADAMGQAERSGLRGQAARLEKIGLKSRVVVNTDLDTIVFLAQDVRKNYAPYLRQVAAGVRKPAQEQHHRDRRVVDSALFPGYEDKIVFGALTGGWLGLRNYGKVAMFLKEAVAQKRVSLLIENSFKVFDKHFKWGRPFPSGYRAVWDDRSRLIVVKLTERLKANATEDELGGLILRQGASREKDEFIEVHIFDTFDLRAVECVRLMSRLHAKAERKRWRLTRELLEEAGVPVREDVPI